MTNFTHPCEFWLGWTSSNPFLNELRYYNLCEYGSYAFHDAGDEHSETRI